MEYDKIRQKINELMSDWSRFQVDFFDREKFSEFAHQLSSQVGDLSEICITGYFSETIRNELQKMIKRGKKVRLICPELTKSNRDRKNLQALRKLVGAGAEIKVNNRLHARFLVAHITQKGRMITGILLLGSFDFNKDGVSKERYDAGLFTRHPDLINSAIQLFDKIWEDEYSSYLLEKHQ